MGWLLAIGVQLVCSWLQLVCNWCTIFVQLVCSWCAIGFQLVCNWCAIPRNGDFYFFPHYVHTGWGTLPASDLVDMRAVVNWLRGLKQVTHLHLNPRLRKREPISPLSYQSSWRHIIIYSECVMNQVNQLCWYAKFQVFCEVTPCRLANSYQHLHFYGSAFCYSCWIARLRRRRKYIFLKRRKLFTRQQVLMYYKACISYTPSLNLGSVSSPFCVWNLENSM